MNAPVSEPVKTLESLMPGCFPDADKNIVITGISSDSRAVLSGDLFFALRGCSNRSTDFALQAVESGAAAVATDNPVTEDSILTAPVCLDVDLQAKLSFIASRFYGKPSEQMDVIGITGTNGKTSCCFWLSWMLNELDISAGQIGTLGAGLTQLQPTGFTTPDPIQTQKLLESCRRAGAEVVVMEVSSHGLDQSRVDGVQFESAVFTNFSQDHLDYHKDMDDYLRAKLKLFRCVGLKRAVVNIDDDAGSSFACAVGRDVELVTYSLGNTNNSSAKADLYFTSIMAVEQGFKVVLNGRWGEAEILIPVFGRYNLSNLLAVASVALSKGVDFSDVVELMGRVPSVPGRMQKVSVEDCAGLPSVVVDYAHTPEAVEVALGALALQTQSRLLVVLGCGGGRDQSKRPLMAKAAVEHSDVQIFTSDNPRDEFPETILQEMLHGLSADQKSSVVVIEERRDALKKALEVAKKEDLIVVLGKGHEGFQEVAGTRAPFDDVEVCQQLLTEMVDDLAKGVLS